MKKIFVKCAQNMRCTSSMYEQSLCNDEGGGGGEGTLLKCSKTLYYKTLLETYFVKTCR